MNENEKQLDLLGILHMVLGGMVALFACVFLIHVAIGLAMLTGLMNGDAPRAAGLLFLVMGGVTVLLGWVMGGVIVVAGLNLRRRRARTFCMVVAGLECLIMPLGTILGVFTLLALNRDSTRALFAEPR